MKFAFRFALVCAIALACLADAQAGWRARRSASTSTTYSSSATVGTSCVNGVCTTTATATATTTTTTVTGSALDEVNAKRAARGLRPYIFDAGLTEAAHRAASFRAERRLFGHTSGGMGDFAFLPAGACADAAGCAAYPPSYGFLACAVYENYTYAGAATVIGSDGRAYHHLFVRR